MKKPVNAILLSALVFPGAGHVYLKKTKTGLTLISLTLLSLIYIIADIMDRAFDVVEQIQMGNVPPDTATITAMVEQQPGGEWLGMASYTIVICWLFGIVGCYLLGKKLADNN